MLIGTDSELFATLNGLPVSAHDLVPGTKEDPFLVPNGAVQVDGMALEFNTDPADSEDLFVANVASVMAQLKSMIGEHEFHIEPVAHFTELDMLLAPYEAKRLGCSADYNAWAQGAANASPDASVLFRTAGGHVHIGWTEDASIQDPEHLAKCEAVIKEMDYRIGLQSVLLDGDVERRTMYGAAGAYRPKSYGVEYRTLSNYWLKSEEWTRMVYRKAAEALQAVENGTAYHEVYGNLAQEIINTSDVEAATALLQSLGEI